MHRSRPLRWCLTRFVRLGGKIFPGALLGSYRPAPERSTIKPCAEPRRRAARGWWDCAAGSSSRYACRHVRQRDRRTHARPAPTPSALCRRRRRPRTPGRRSTRHRARYMSAGCTCSNAAASAQHRRGRGRCGRARLSALRAQQRRPSSRRRRTRARSAICSTSSQRCTAPRVEIARRVVEQHMHAHVRVGAAAAGSSSARRQAAVARRGRAHARCAPRSSVPRART